MPNHAMTLAAHALHAARLDRDDPFMSRRMASQAALGVPMTYDYSRARRQPQTIADRFRLIRSRS
jgi:hypothetical protein